MGLFINKKPSKIDFWKVFLVLTPTHRYFVASSFKNCKLSRKVEGLDPLKP